MEFLKERTEGMLFPQPKDGETVQISPPSFTWLPANGATNYRIIIKKSNKEKIYEKEVENDPIHLPDIVFKPGKYLWDVVAVDTNKNEINRGEQCFSIYKNAIELSWVAPEKLLNQVSEGHPRLLYTDHLLSQIRKTINSTRRQTWFRCKKAADNALGISTPRYPTYQNIDDPMQRRLEYKKYYQELATYLDGALINLSIAYLVSGDKKYSHAGKRILLEITSWPTTDDDVTSVSSRWGDEPGLHIAKCAHRAYDWLYDSLNEDERCQILTMCEARAWQVYRRLKENQNFLTFPGESHAGRLVAYLAEMAIVMAADSEGAKEWLNYSLKALTTLYPHWGTVDGGWAEGMDYAKDYNSFYIPALETLRTTCNFNLWQRPFFRNLRYFFLYCSSPLNEMQPFGDGADRPGPSVNGSPYINLMAYYAYIFQDPYVGWWAKQIPSFEGITSEYSLIFKGKLPTKRPVNLQNSKLFQELGWAGLHSNLSNPESDTFLLFKSSPFGSASHSHADQNSFAIMKGGKALAIPSGYYGPLYGAPHHSEWTRSTKANNCVLVNGIGQTPRSSKAKGNITSFEEGKSFTYLKGEAATAYNGDLLRFYRHILFLRPGLFLMLDDLKTVKDSKFQWMLHALEEMTVIKNNQITSRRSGSILDIHLSCPQGLTITQTDKFDTPYNAGIPTQFHKNMPNHWHIMAETNVKSSTTRIGAAMIVSDSREPVKVQILSQEGWFGARVMGDFGEVEGWVQTLTNTSGPVGFGDKVSNGNAMICGRTSDGKIFSK